MVAILLLAATWSSCDKDEAIPGYIYIPKISLSVNSNGSQGSNAHDLVDAWVFIEGETIGVFELPARIPILKTGETEIVIVAGIKKNGIANDRMMYPFLKAYTTTVDLVPSEVDTLQPVVQYADNVVFPWLEDFEDQSISLTRSGSSTSIDSMYIVDDPLLVFGYDGIANKYSAGVELDTGFQIFENSSVQLFDLPRSGREVFLEFNYKTESELITGVYPITGSVVSGIPIVNLYPSNEWKKVYVSLKEDINNPEFTGADFRIFFHSQTNTETEIPKIHLDNIKLVHFES